ncbi:putative quinol monooxygenase [Nocardia stercoris]|uniref:Antibiotic biosynthesis monooxygenase n=1 Tax=Nocardia stercoris TaxID=2483361 RepID=A0A3M2KZE8_9NOCA|nr:putative quinol monooxygenase [Nocardia stercoris]RMI30514.1 antibiotic biosynthesis monooxygenase [Nocardia stercoris]
MAEPCVVVATMIAKPGREDLVEKTLRAAAPAVHAEPGCLQYALHRELKQPGRFVMIEKWASREALREHGQGTALREVGVALADALVAAPEVRVFEPLPAGDPDKGAL